MLSDRRLVRKRLYAPVLAVVAALAVLGTAGAAEAHSAMPKANVSAATLAGGVSLETETELPEAEIDFVIKVRLAGLWEIPGGRMAVEKGVSPRVRQVGQMIADQHVRLDALSVAAAKELDIPLPDVPTPEQRRWLDEMTDAEGAAFDDVFVQRLRAAHGKIFPVIGVVRATTENDTVRKLAQSTNAFVLTHLTLLESTGLVRYEQLPQAADPATGVTGLIAGVKYRSAEGGVAPLAIWAILAFALISGVIYTARMIRPRSFGGKHKGNLHASPEGRMGTGAIPVQSSDNYRPKQGLRLGSGPRSLP